MSKNTNNFRTWIVVQLSFTAILFLADLALGSASIPLAEIPGILISGPSGQEAWSEIIWKIRFPRSITAFLAGSCLSVSGLLMQSFFRNPIAGPFVLGISSGSSLGVALLVMGSSAFGVNLMFNPLAGWSIAFFSIMGAMLVLLVVLKIANRVQEIATLLIIGLLFGSAVGSLVSVLEYFSDQEALKRFVIWGFGSLGGVSWNELGIMVPVLAFSVAWAFLLSKSLNALLLGEEYSQSIGLRIKVVRRQVLLVTALLAGTVTAFCGPIAFIGIAVPHLARMTLRNQQHSKLTPITFLIGGNLMILCDIIAQVPGSAIQLPINAVTSILGAPLVIWIVMSYRQA